MAQRMKEDGYQQLPEQIRTNNDLRKGNQLKIQNDLELDFIIQVPEKTLSQNRKTRFTKCRRQESAKNSTAKYREKKKKELTVLEKIVKGLENELIEADQQINSVKQQILLALQSLAKMNQRSSNENIEIYHDLEVLLTKANLITLCSGENCSLFVDFDQINMLLDTLKYRIGASGKQRQNKLAYHYKSIINTIFPALYRYILFNSLQNFEVFTEQNPKFSDWEWTRELINKLDVNASQINQIKGFNNRLHDVFEGTQAGIAKLNQIRQKLRLEGQNVEGVEQKMRQILNPNQCARWTLFAEKHKYRREVMIELQLFSAPSFSSTNKQQPVKEQCIDQFQIVGRHGRKRIKIDPDC